MTATREQQFERVLAALRQLDSEGFAEADAQTIAFNAKSWDAYLFKAGRADLATILRAVPEVAQGASITRQHVVELAGSATTSEGREALLVGTLVWGKGVGNNRMFPAFVRLLRDVRLNVALSASAEHSAAGRPADAYQAWRRSGVTGLGEAFFTKWFWAASSIGGRTFTAEHPRCLVLDTRVWNTLGHPDHRWSSVEAAGTRLRPQRYAAYTRECARWAVELGVSAEQVEWALFAANGSLDQLNARIRKGSANA